MAKAKPRLYVDQYGGRIYADTVKSLKEQAGGRVSKMYVDGKDGKTYHVGYVVGNRWFTAYEPVKVLA